MFSDLMLYNFIRNLHTLREFLGQNYKRSTMLSECWVNHLKIFFRFYSQSCCETDLWHVRLGGQIEVREVQQNKIWPIFTVRVVFMWNKKYINVKSSSEITISKLKAKYIYIDEIIIIFKVSFALTT